MVDAVVSNMLREVEPDQDRGTSSLHVPRDVFEVGDDGKVRMLYFIVIPFLKIALFKLLSFAHYSSTSGYISMQRTTDRKI